MRSTPKLFVLAIVAACTPSDGFLNELPEEVVALAAENQNLQAVILLEEDGCYWVEHDGPVERTLIPLVTKRGRQICIQQQN